MKKITKILLVILAIVIILFFIYPQVKERFKCSWWHKENCDVACYTDSDCKQSSCCTCINKEEVCSTSRWAILGETGVEPMCIQLECKCTNNQCISNL